MADKYYVMYSSEDGFSINEMTGEELRKRLAEGWWGRVDSFFDAMPKFVDCGFDAHGAERKLFILRGAPFVPKAKRVVEEWEVP